MKKKILIVEDDLVLQETICLYLQKSNYNCECVEDIKSAENILLRKLFDVVLLDLGLPDGDGLDFIGTIKGLNRETSVIIISARDKIDDRVNGLNLGADDFLVKPFHLSELIARINAVLRRNLKFNKDGIIVFDDIELDISTHKARIRDKYLDLSRKEFALMLYFIENKGTVLTKEGLFEHVWGENSVFMGNVDFIYTHINRLRKKMRNAGGRNYIKTVHGIGYKLDIS